MEEKQTRFVESSDSDIKKLLRFMQDMKMNGTIMFSAQRLPSIFHIIPRSFTSRPKIFISQPQASPTGGMY